ncbi:uncharacterized protein K441DRAFT_657778 [Cenococcum geophilum 1.58]|uniref:uncharacterized protein n=1 Tax=Cenococcum geophilum 1.58 TaxID=794803 RepID=UPI00358F973E|nr:hypothetical protein K441DRAFT_657778 [Cenococcum geophilum 1.58]
MGSRPSCNKTEFSFLIVRSTLLYHFVIIALPLCLSASTSASAPALSLYVDL